MNTPLIRLTAAVVALPVAQREVLLPVFAWLLLDKAPDGAEMPQDLLEQIEDFFATLGPDHSAWGDAIEARLRAVGVTSATLQELALQAGTAEAELTPGKFARELASKFEARTEPQAGQAKSGPAARFALLGMTEPGKGTKKRHRRA